jgi:hypothetical protein
MPRVKSRLQRFAQRYAAGTGVFDESKHDRANDGKFAPKGGGGTGAPKPKSGGSKKPKGDGAAGAYESVLSSRVPADVPVRDIPGEGIDDDIPFGEVVDDEPKPAYKPRAQTSANPKRPANAPKPEAKPAAKPEADKPGAASAESIKDAFHVALDGIGLIPGWGEAADLVNAATYLAEGKYLMAGLSLVSMVPVVGDAIGKSGKALLHGNKYSRKVLEQVGPLIAKNWPAIKGAFAKAKELKPYVEPIDRAIQEVLAAHRQAKAAAPAPAKKPPAKPKAKPQPVKNSRLERYARRVAVENGRSRIQQPMAPLNWDGTPRK